MPDLRVAHIVIRRKADGRAVGGKADGGILAEQTVKGGGIGGGDGVGAVCLGKADTVHHDGEDGAGNRGKFL